MNIRFFISPFFLNRQYLYKLTKSTVFKYKFEGNVLDIGCGVKPYKKLFVNSNRYDGIDFKNYSDNNSFNIDKPDFFFNTKYISNSQLPFKNQSYDHTLAFQVLEHHKNPDKLIKEMYRITKKGGFIFLSVPFLGGIHEEPSDFQRYTKFGLINLFSKYDCKIAELEPYGSIFSTISMLLNEYICNFSNKSKFNHAVSIIIYPPLLIFQYISWILDKFFKSDQIVRGYVILVKKNNN